MRRSKRAAATAVTVVVVVLLTSVLAVALAPSDRRRSPGGSAVEAATALSAARDAGADRRAPVNFRYARELYSEGLLLLRRQDLRLGVLRDYRPAGMAFARATDRARMAAEVARKVERSRRRQSDEVVASARNALRSLTGLEEQVWLPPYVRLRLQAARGWVAEASTLVDSGAFALAEARAVRSEREVRSVRRTVQAMVERYAAPESVRVWRSWIADAVAGSRRTGGIALVVDKDEHRMTVYSAGRVIRRYDVELGWNNTAAKRQRGDGATPEGRYHIVELKGGARSRYHRAFLLDYPGPDDLRALRTLRASGGVAATARPGDLIEIHGAGGRGRDWTDGCVALSDPDIDDLARRVGVGTPVVIVGSATGRGRFASVARRMAR